MHKSLVIVAAVALLTTPRARAQGAPRDSAFALELPYPDMIAEDVASDSATGSFYISSVHRGGIYRVDSAGHVSTFAQPGANGGWGMFGIAIDAHRQRLWVVTAAMPIAARYTATDSGRSALLEYDLHTGEFVAKHTLPDTGAHALGDLTVSANGTVYASDGIGSGVYVLPVGADTMRVLVPRGVMGSPQTPALSLDERTLFVPDYDKGMASIDLRTRAVSWLAHGDSVELRGIDGMYRVGRDLIVVQNGTKTQRIRRLTLDPTLKRVIRSEIVASGGSVADITHAAVVGPWLYFIVRSGWSRVHDDGTMAPGFHADAPALVRTELSPS